MGAILANLSRKGSQQSFLLGRKNLSRANYKSVGHSKERMTKNKKFMEIQSAALPEIDTAISTGFKKNNLIVDKLPKEQEKERKVEYIHEEVYDAESK